MAEVAEAAHILESKKELVKIDKQFFDTKKCAESAETATEQKMVQATQKKLVNS